MNQCKIQLSTPVWLCPVFSTDHRRLGVHSADWTAGADWDLCGENVQTPDAGHQGAGRLRRGQSGVSNPWGWGDSPNLSRSCYFDQHQTKLTKIPSLINCTLLLQFYSLFSCMLLINPWWHYFLFALYMHVVDWALMTSLWCWFCLVQVSSELAQERDFFQTQLQCSIQGTPVPVTPPASPEKHHLVVELADCKAKIRRLRQDL